MDEAGAKQLTKLYTREFPEARFEFLRCQLGLWEYVTVKLSAFRSVNEKVWRLLFFGSSWEEAVKMWEMAQKREVL